MNLKHFYLLIFFSVIGLGLSIYLAYLYSIPQPVICVGEVFNSCEVVRNSTHSYFLGVRLPILGIAFFASLLVLEVAWLQDKLSTKGFFDYFGLLLIPGFIFETYKTIIQFTELNAICIWCTAIEVTVLALLVVYGYAFKNNRKNAKSEY